MEREIKMQPWPLLSTLEITAAPGPKQLAAPFTVAQRFHDAGRRPVTSFRPSELPLTPISFEARRRSSLACSDFPAASSSCALSRSWSAAMRSGVRPPKCATGCRPFIRCRQDKGPSTTAFPRSGLWRGSVEQLAHVLVERSSFPVRSFRTRGIGFDAVLRGTLSVSLFLLG